MTMFGQVPPGDDGQIGDPMSAPSIPPKRRFVVKLRQGEWTETRTIDAHMAENVGAGGVAFREFMLHPQEGPTNRIILMILRPNDGWLEYEEQYIEGNVILATSGIVTH